MAEQVVFVPDPVSWNRVFKSWSGGPGTVGSHMLKTTEKVAVLARAEAPGPGKPPRNRTMWNYATGELQTKIITTRGHGGLGQDLEGHVVALADHALMVHEGTAPHIIVPKNPTKFLVFKVRPTMTKVRAKKVKHPGTKANNFLVRALSKGVAGVSLP